LIEVSDDYVQDHAAQKKEIEYGMKYFKTSAYSG
jgi:hypothetical protein